MQEKYKNNIESKDCNQIRKRMKHYITRLFDSVSRRRLHLLSILILIASSSFKKENMASASFKYSAGARLQTDKADAILGEWVTLQKNLKVLVYKKDNNYRAKITWFKVEDQTRPMNTRLDEKNPDPALRTRKWLGMEVLRNLRYSKKDDEWESGIIYDAKHGREWDSVAWINKDGLLKVKGYWLFQWISETLIFERVC